jgi:two-component system phosphate regulon sensor histidine kinase PhoR
LFFRRLAGGVLLMSLGAGLGWGVGHSFGLSVWGCWCGAALGVLLHEGRDALRSRRLLRWLRHAQATEAGASHAELGDAPRDDGVWGELAYRVERLLRNRENALAAEKAQLADFLSAIEASPSGVLLIDADEQIAWCNSVAADHFGLDPRRDRNQRVTNLLRSPAFVAYLQGGAFDEPISMRMPGGEGMLSVLIRRYGKGMSLVLSNDVTERLRNEAMRRDFVANVSHEIRTPLTVLAGFIETLVNLPLTEVERHRVLSLMTQQAQRMQGLVADLLALAQLEGSPRPSADTWVPVTTVLAQAATEAQGLSRGRHQLVFPAMDAPGSARMQRGQHVPLLPLLQLAGSQSELVSALTNLVSNAVRYTPEGGRVEVACALRPDGSLCFSVSDTGIGIAREHLPRLTQRFYRVDGSRSRETGGTGLGLAIVKHVVQRHGGELLIDSEPGKGSVFRLVFPAVRVRTEAAHDAAAPRPPVEALLP